MSDELLQELKEANAQLFDMRVLLMTALRYGLSDSSVRAKLGTITDELFEADRKRLGKDLAAE